MQYPHLRQKLGDDPRSPKKIKTIRGVGTSREGRRVNPFAFTFAAGCIERSSSGSAFHRGDDGGRPSASLGIRRAGGLRARDFLPGNSRQPGMNPSATPRPVQDLGVDVRLADPDGVTLSAFGASCPHGLPTAIEKDGISSVRSCLPEHEHGPRFLFPILIAVVML